LRIRTYAARRDSPHDTYISDAPIDDKDNKPEEIDGHEVLGNLNIATYVLGWILGDDNILSKSELFRIDEMYVNTNTR
jgi:hypothetical protein